MAQSVRGKRSLSRHIRLAPVFFQCVVWVNRSTLRDKKFGCFEVFMRFYMASAATLLLFSSILPLQASRAKRGPTAKHKKTQTAAQHQRAMDDSRATQIQTALVKAGYLKEASGHWDAESQAAMQKLQADNGWQTKLVPDSRALIKLGLGPSSQPSSVPVALSEGGPAAATDTETFGGK
jgi:hypothetical protein